MGSCIDCLKRTCTDKNDKELQNPTESVTVISTSVVAYKNDPTSPQDTDERTQLLRQTRTKDEDEWSQYSKSTTDEENDETSIYWDRVKRNRNALYEELRRKYKINKKENKTHSPTSYGTPQTHRQCSDGATSESAGRDRSFSKQVWSYCKGRPKKKKNKDKTQPPTSYGTPQTRSQWSHGSTSETVGRVHDSLGDRGDKLHSFENTTARISTGAKALAKHVRLTAESAERKTKVRKKHHSTQSAGISTGFVATNDPTTSRDSDARTPLLRPTQTEDEEECSQYSDVTTDEENEPVERKKKSLYEKLKRKYKIKKKKKDKTHPTTSYDKSQTRRQCFQGTTSEEERLVENKSDEAKL